MNSLFVLGRCGAVVCVLLLALAFAGVLTGCGGGGDEDDGRATTQPVDCKLFPEQCK
jgi:hypothetical protein